MLKISTALKVSKTCMLLSIIYSMISNNVEGIYERCKYFLIFDFVDVPYMVFWKSDISAAGGMFIHHAFLLIMLNCLNATQTLGLYNIYTLVLYRLVANFPWKYRHHAIVSGIAFVPQAIVPTIGYTLQLDIVHQWIHLFILMLMQYAACFYFAGVGIFILLKQRCDLSFHVSYKNKNDEYVMQVIV